MSRPPDLAALEKARTSEGNFFAVSREAFHRVCECGVNAACMYLVMARGTGPDNVTSSWSCHALEKYTSISRRRAVIARDDLVRSSFVKSVGSQSKPRYKLLKSREDELVWLPNEFVTGAVEETPPLERLRETNDPLIFRLLIDVYAGTNIADDAGLPIDVVYGEYERTHIADFGQYSIWGFNFDVDHCIPNSTIVSPHSNSNNSQEFFNRLRVLTDLGLVLRHPVLFDSSGGEIIHELIDPFGILESVKDEIDLSLYRMFEDNEAYFGQFPCYQYVVPVLSHIKDVCVRDVFYPRYRQKTKLTSAGMAQTQGRMMRAKSAYMEIAK